MTKNKSLSAKETALPLNPLAWNQSKRDAARFLGISEATLSSWITHKTAPPYRKIGGKAGSFPFV